MNSFRGKLGSYPAASSRTVSSDISKLSLRELMAEEFPVDPFLSGRNSLLPNPVSKRFVNDEPRRPGNWEYPLFNQRDYGKPSMTDYANSFHETSTRENPPRYGDSVTRERPFPDRALVGMNNSQFGEMYGYGNGDTLRKSSGEFVRMNNSQFGELYGSYGNGDQHRNSQQEQFRPYERQGGGEQQKSEKLNLSDYVNILFTEGERSNNLTLKTRLEEKKAVEDLLVVQDTAVAEVPDYIKKLLAKVLSRDKTVKKESFVSSDNKEENPSQSEDKASKTDLAKYVQTLYARIESDREKILKYEDLLKQDMDKEQDKKSEKNIGDKQSAQPALPIAQPALPIAQPALPIAQPVLPIAQPALPVAQPALPIAQSALPIVQSVLPIVQSALPIVQPAEGGFWEVDGTSRGIAGVWKELVSVKPSRPRPPEFPSLTEGILLHQDYYQTRVGLTSRSPRKSRSRSPRRYRSKSPGRKSKSPRRSRRSPPRRARSRSPKRYSHRSRSPKESKTSSESSNSLVAVLKLIISAIKKTNTNYSLDILQDNSSVDFFRLPSAFKISLLICGFQLRLSTSSTAHGYHWSMLRDVLEFSQGCDLHHEVYVEAKAHDDSIDIHDTKSYELAEYFRDTDVTIDFKSLDQNLVNEFQSTLRGAPLSRLHPTQNRLGPARPSIFSRLGN